MEEVPACVHPNPINLEVLTRSHEHRSGLIWSGDHETYITDLQYVEQDPRAPLGAMWWTSFDLSQDQLDLMSSDQFVWLPYLERGLISSDLWMADVPLICYEIVEYHHLGYVI
ncbi:hypothetical protein M9H77_15822 [Catharanthus roseus]|uniref:Uncharacterized protein n=1 Tax=Catharanthus roseus TaxID=4058 RepID=A0ACC0B0E2_CATRO|nr:hypothetical protein M9H77_15822 [Catharanthus roseus]